jgi:hypothetical protein
MFQWIWLIWILAGIGIELTALLTGGQGTLSELVWRTARDYPLLPLAFGVLMGHFFWQRVQWP